MSVYLLIMGWFGIALILVTIYELEYIILRLFQKFYDTVYTNAYSI